MKNFVFILTLILFAVFNVSLPAQETKPAATTDTDKKTIELTVEANRVIVRNATVGQRLEVFSVVGLKMDTVTMKAIAAEYTLNVPKGYYILKIGETVRKIVIK
ncbi:MAG: T9SS C-terminal target domain-containing protein [Dysgonamonadaceae bacterium]|jgi:hypothetical protein|nr:T9SS C-terminal target domain-containing protein [Dysgonamonadaceae bacterium]